MRSWASRFRSAVWVMCFAAGLAGAQDTSGEARAQDEARRLVKAHIAWSVNLPTPGAAIEARRMPDKNGHADYRLFVTGVASGQVYTIMTWPVSKSTAAAVLDGATLGSDGLVMCAGRTPDQCGDAAKKDDPVEFVFDAAKGEPYRVAIVSASARATIVIVADPISITSRGCALDVERLLPHFELAYFSGSGFPPNSDVSFHTQSYEEEHAVIVKSDDRGRVKFWVAPFVAGHQRGTTTLKTAGAKCDLSLSFDWGQ